MPRLDEAQLAVGRAFDALAARLNQLPKPGLLGRLFSRGAALPKGLYVWGHVGRGKTMLMDSFFASVQGLPKRRVHFNGFMQEVHAARARLKSDDVIGDIADGIARDTKLLCLDEMQVTDIADAMILGRLFEALLARGVVLVTTSNQPPDGLYKDGLNRQLFLPFIARLKEALEVVHLGEGPDYRLGRIAARHTYVTPLGPAADAALDALWSDLTDGVGGEAMEITILGRSLHVPRAAHGCARFSFSDLCEKPLAAPDYLALAQNFSTVFIDHLPVLKASERNEAKRLILLIDTLYDAGTRLVVSAAAAPEALCPAGPHRLEFLRTASRLREMQSQSWWQKAA
ncbi:MAG: AFG1 family ATPase [Alphaproteobacteria bacterium]|nr:AFG1 family ATPase [Alphaproteobacteria bacterium]